MRNSIATHFSISVPATLAFDYPTMGALTSFIAASLAARRNAAEQQTAARQANEQHPAAQPDMLHRVATELDDILTVVIGHRVEPDQPFMEV